MYVLRVTRINLYKNIQLIMAAAKPAPKGASKMNTVCAECDTEFTGKTCPECGNGTGNSRLAADGIKQEFHTNDGVFGSVDELEGYVRTTDEDFLMSVQNAKMARDEFTENMRQSQVMSSEIKKIEKESKLYQKKKDLERLKEGWGDNTYPPEQPAAGSPLIAEQPLFGAHSPQAQFMSQLMRMDADKRAEFMNQLSDADPMALQTLSTMFVQPANPVAQQMGQQGMPGMYPSPWMQQPQQQTEQKESTTVIMREMFSLMKEMQPQKDDSATEIIRDLKDEIVLLRSRVDSVNGESSGRNNNLDGVIQYIKGLEKKIEAVQYKPSFSDQAKELKETIQNLESIGLVNNTNGAVSVDDKIRMKEIDHKIDMENKQYGLDESANETNLLKQQVKEDLVKNIFTQGFLLQSNKPEQEEKTVAQNPFVKVPLVPVGPVVMEKPRVVVDNIESDSGTVREMRDAPGGDE